MGHPPETPSPRPTLVKDGPPDDAQAFERAYHAAVIARAERELIEARWRADHFLSPLGHYSPLWDQREEALNALLNAVIEVVLIPATTKGQIARKKEVIGRVWLKAKGELYDSFRRSVAEDEANLTGRC